MSQTKTWKEEVSEDIHARLYGDKEVYMQREIDALRAELTLHKNVMVKAAARLRGCGVSNYTIDSVADSLELFTSY